MNKIEVKSSTLFKEYDILCDTFVFFEDCNFDVKFNILNDSKLFVCLINSKVKCDFNIVSNLIFNFFNVNSAVNITLDLNKEDIKLDYVYSTLNIDDNNYCIDINHNFSNQISNIVNHGLNLESNKLDFIINAIVPKNSCNINTNQDSKIIVLKENNAFIRPNLLVDNDDVVANHSAYIGDFKKEDIFYLSSRGITLLDSRFLLAKSFLIGKMNISYKEIDVILDKLNKYWR